MLLSVSVQMALAAGGNARAQSCANRQSGMCGRREERCRMVGVMSKERVAASGSRGVRERACAGAMWPAGGEVGAMADAQRLCG